MTSTLQVRIDSDLRRDADRVFDDIGMDTNGAIRLFLRQVVIRRTFPFEVIGSAAARPETDRERIDRAIDDLENGRNCHFHELIDVDQDESVRKSSRRRRTRAKALVR